MLFHNLLRCSPLCLRKYLCLPPAMYSPIKPSPLPPLAWFLLCLLSLLALGLGIWEPTSLTGKDEFFLGLRTPMEMMERQEWLVPFLDGVPRIRKPPMLYWLARLSYETFGISLASARLVTVLFGTLMVLATVGIGRRLLGDSRAALLAGGIMLGFLGMASESRRLMLDIPVAALSASAFWAFLVWQEKQKFLWLALSAMILAAGFLVKGPIVALVCGGGLLALMTSHRLHPADLLKKWPSVISSLMLLAAIALPWFILVRSLHPEAAAAVYAEEMEARQLLNFSPDMIPGLLQICLPWSFIAIVLIWQSRRQAWREAGPERLLLVWLLATCLPFLLIRTFDRYLVGSLVPLALLLGWQLRDKTQLPLWPARIGMILAILFGGLISLFAWRFNLGGWYFWLPAALYFGWAWGWPRNTIHWLTAPVVYWVTLLWGVFPALDVNAVPPQVLELGKTRQIAMYDGPQPALLPILSARPLKHWRRVDEETAKNLMAQDGLVFVESGDLPRFESQLAKVGLQAIPQGKYKVLASHGSGLRFARIGATRADWQQAWRNRDPSPLMTEIHWLSLAYAPQT